jgi:hypothetical protein
MKTRELAKELLEGSRGRFGIRSDLCSVGLLLLAVALLNLAFATAPAGAKVPADSENATATHAYLVAINTYEEAQLRNLPQSEMAIETLRAQIAGECPGVLAGAPGEQEQELVATSLHAVSPVSPRVEGEQHRQSIQQEDLKLELAVALEGASAQPNREASEALVSALTPLRWSNATLALLVHLTVASTKEQLETPVLDVCADMRQWVASGFKTLSATSKDIAIRGNALFEDALELFAIIEDDHLKSFAGVLGRYETRSDRSFARRNGTLQAELQSSRVSEKNTLKGLEAKVGLPAPKTYKKLLPTPKQPPVVARGRTAVGGRFVVRAERRSHRPDPIGCSAYITIEEPSRSREGLLESLSSGGGTSRCVSRAQVVTEPTVRCNAGLLTVEASLLAATSSVRLLLSNGTTITSAAIRVPARQGGPAGIYYQVVHGPSPIPASLTELDASGNTLTVLKLPAVVECTKRLIKYLPDGIVTLAHGSLPQGPSFTIRGEGYRKLGALHFELKLAVSNDGSGGLFEAGGGSSFGTSIEEPEVSDGELNPRAQLLGTAGLPFASHASSECVPQPYVIVYGLLKAPGDTVLVRVAGTLVALQKVAIPARLHAHGVLAYGAFSPLPTELLVRDASGKTVASRNLSAPAQSNTEKCEGEAE